jgi:hypothetical protein
MREVQRLGSTAEAQRGTQRKPAAAVRALIGFAAISGLAIFAGGAWGRQASNTGASSSSATAAGSSQGQASADASAGSNAQSASGASAAPADSLAAAARRAKEQKSQVAKPAKVFTNDNLPAGGISTVGVTRSDSSADSADAAAPAAQGEKFWRDKFATLNKKLEQDQAELEVMQRELGVLNLQNYSDPTQAMQQGLSRSDIGKKTADIDAKQKEIEADKQAIDDAQDDLRKAGGDPGWGR